MAGCSRGCDRLLLGLFEFDSGHGGEVMALTCGLAKQTLSRLSPNQPRAPEGSQVGLFAFSLCKILLAVHQGFN
jgi:hypothetical protein